MYDFNDFLERAKGYEAESARLLAVQEINAIERRLSAGGKGVVAYRESGAPHYAAQLKKFKFWMDNLFAGLPVPIQMLTAYKPILDVYREVYPNLAKRLDEIPNDPECKTVSWLS